MVARGRGWGVGAGGGEEVSEDGPRVQTSSYKMSNRASLVAQWLRIRLPMQGTQVQALVQEDPTCRGATKPVRHNY